MPAELQVIPGAPAEVHAALVKLAEDLTIAARGNLAGLVLYGGLARGRFRPGKSDVNVVVLLNDVSAGSLAAIAAPLKAAWRAAAVEPMLLTPDEVPRAAADFPTKFLDIHKHHIALAGTSPFATLQITREQVGQRVEQELRNLLLRLRHDYVGSAGDIPSLALVLTRTVRPLAIQLAALLYAAGKAVPVKDRSAAIFEAAAAEFLLDRQALARLAALRDNPAGGDALVEMFATSLATVGGILAVAERMNRGA